MTGNRRLLIVDDDEDIREVAQVTLEVSTCWEIVTAASGEGGIRTAVATPPDAILLDVMMPDLDGPSTLRHLRSHHETAGVPVIFLTAKVQATDRKRLEGLPISGVIAKPFDPMTLAGEIAAILGWDRAEGGSRV
ncbi:MAG TPA: response regulator [Symbiobacteriaceae bacterium]|nr:response regulator [Symbiobacteriaceae bacterium]